MSDNVTTAVSTRILDNAGLTTGDLEKTLGKIMRRSIDEADLYLVRGSRASACVQSAVTRPASRTPTS